MGFWKCFCIHTDFLLMGKKLKFYWIINIINVLYHYRRSKYFFSSTNDNMSTNQFLYVSMKNGYSSSFSISFDLENCWFFGRKTISLLKTFWILKYLLLGTVQKLRNASESIEGQKFCSNIRFGFRKSLQIPIKGEFRVQISKKLYCEFLDRF